MRPKRCKKANNKVIFRTELDARISLARRRDNHNKAKIPVRFYQCEFSPEGNPHFHVTSDKERNVGESSESQEDEAGERFPWASIHSAALRFEEGKAS